jgi:EAL domain-containing protein (putative c-di-GMP-specific phosphodiesterase class I)
MLGMRAVGEGIETASQVAQLRALGCDFGQGFHLARPMSASRLSSFLGRPDALAA